MRKDKEATRTRRWMELGAGILVLGGLLGLAGSGLTPSVTGFALGASEAKCDAVQASLEEQQRTIGLHKRAIGHLLKDARWNEDGQREFLASAIVDSKHELEDQQATARELHETIVAMNCP